MNINSYDRLGQSGMALMQNSMNLAGSVAENLASGDADVMDIAKASMDMTQAKVGMKLGAFLIRSQNEMMESVLEIFGVGTKHSGVY